VYIKFEKRTLINPQGLDEILSEILCHPVHGDWDKNIPAIQYIGTLSEKEKSGRIGDFWGMMMERHAREYLAKNLQELGWTLKSEKIGRTQYDCIGRKQGVLHETPELAVEMYFPQPKIEADAEYYSATEHSIKMIRRLVRIQAKRKYILIGIPKDIPLNAIIHPHPTIKILYQEHEFKEIVFQPTT
jgi:hypothetical protein